MIDTSNNLRSFTDTNREQLQTMLEKIFTAAHPDAVYSQPIVSGAYTVITASEVVSGGGFGSGAGFGSATPSVQKQPDKTGAQSEQASSGGSGIGGGGGSMGRPVAVIMLGPDGVTIKPVFDLTKIALAGISAWITMLVVLRRARKVRRSGLSHQGLGPERR